MLLIPANLSKPLVATLLTVLALGSLAIQHSRISRTSDNRTKLDSFRYLHIPKTGTSFIIVLRNYLDACPVKGFSCPGVQGGGGEFVVNRASGKKKMQKFDFGVSEEQMRETIHCGGKLLACGAPAPNPRHSHLPWSKNEEPNVVTMLRDPMARLVSHFAWYRAIRDSNEEKLAAFEELVETCQTNMTVSNGCPLFASDSGVATAALSMLAGFFPETVRTFNDNDFVRARRRLLNETVFFGLTDMWKESVCTFHCELGGQIRENELVNTRDNGGFRRELLDGLKPRVKEILERNLALEYRLFDEAKIIFLQRASKCGCLNAVK